MKSLRSVRWHRFSEAGGLKLLLQFSKTHGRTHCWRVITAAVFQFGCWTLLCDICVMYAAKQLLVHSDRAFVGHVGPQTQPRGLLLCRLPPRLAGKRTNSHQSGTDKQLDSESGFCTTDLSSRTGRHRRIWPLLEYVWSTKTPRESILAVTD